MKIIKLSFISILVLVMVPLVLLGQAKRITGENYSSVLKEAESKTYSQIRKTVEIIKRFKQRKVTSIRTETAEYLPPDKWRSVSIEMENGKLIEHIETIVLGDTIYRQKGGGNWVQRKRESVDSGAIWTEKGERSFLIEESIIGGEKFQILTKEVLFLFPEYGELKRYKIWINGKGLITKQTRTIEHLPHRPEAGELVVESEVNYDYKLDPPKIDAPKY
jgi:hypothetical protein